MGSVMGYRDRAISTLADIREGQLELSEESREREKELAAIAAAEKADDAEIAAQMIDETIHGVNWLTGEKMNLTEWSDALDLIEAAPEQRKLYEQARQDEGDTRHEFLEEYFKGHRPLPRR
jgi:hypothetical protein